MSALDPVIVELRARDTQYRALLEAFPDLVFRVDRRGTYLQAWPEDRPDLVVRGKELVGRTVHEVLPPDLAQRLHALITEVVDGRQVGIVEYDLAIRGDPQTFEGRAAPCGPDEVLVIIRNITDRKRAEAEVRGLQGALEERLSELQASRARIVEAADEERRRVERNIHDGAQQRLLATRMSLKLAIERLRRGDVDGAREVVVEADHQLEGAVDELRALAQGIHPAVLTEEGIGAALEVLARRSSVPVELDDVPDGRLPAPVETAVYFVVSEALCNVTKHAQATRAAVTIRQVGARLLVDIVDDGVGGAQEGLGTGLRGLRDRVEALGGELVIESAAGGGTRLRADIPCG